MQDDILSNVIGLVDELRLDPDDLVTEWQAFSMNKKNGVSDDSTIDQKAFRHFAKQLRVSQSARCAKKTKSRSNRFGLHSQQSLGAVLETVATPSRPTRARSTSVTKEQGHEELFSALMSMATPSKSATSTVSHSAVKAANPAAKASSNWNRGQNERSTSTLNESILQSPAPTQSQNETQCRPQSQSSYRPQRQSGDKVIQTLNGWRSPAESVAAVRMEVVVPLSDGGDYQWAAVAVDAVASDVKARRFMMEDVHSKQRAMRDRIEYIGQFLMAQIQSEEEERGAAKGAMAVDKDGDAEDGDDGDDDDLKSDGLVFSALDEPSQRECYFLGRLQNDGEDSGTDKVTAGNVVMESVDGKRVKLNLSGLDSMALFPGQIAAVRGMNSSGKEVVVSALYQSAGLAVKVESGSNSVPNVMSSGGGLEVVIACGPFTARDSVEFEGSTMHSLAKSVNARRPAVVVLMGPFTDCDNEQIKRGEIESSFHDLFERLLSSFLRFVDVDGLQTVVLPSPKDVHHFSAFPQRRYAATPELASWPNLYFLPNPAELRLNNVRVGLCAADLLYDFCRIGLTKNIKDRLLSLMTHCIDQQSFYPLQPAAKSLRMDYGQHRGLYIHDKLDLLIVPSTLKQFAKVHDATNTVCINPSFLTRMNRGGTYAVLNILDSDCYDIEDYSERIKVDIFRI